MISNTQIRYTRTNAFSAHVHIPFVLYDSVLRSHSELTRYCITCTFSPHVCVCVRRGCKCSISVTTTSSLVTQCVICKNVTQDGELE